jgi:hypothetical protein
MQLWQQLNGLVRRRTRRRRVISCGYQIEGLERREVPTVTFQGGEVLNQVSIQGLYLGSNWQSNPTLQAQTAQFDDYLSYLVHSPYFDALASAGYGIQHGTTDAGAIDNSAVRHKLSDKKIRQAIQRDIDTQLVESPNDQKFYVVFVQPNVIVRDGTGNSVHTFYGYHNYFSGNDAGGHSQRVYYAVIPYHSGANGRIPGTANAFDSITEVVSHEVAEGVTDPIPGDSWYAFGQGEGEIGDLTRATSLLNGYTVQNFVGQDEEVFPIDGAIRSPSDSSGNQAGSNGSSHHSRHDHHHEPHRHRITDDVFALRD